MPKIVVRNDRNWTAAAAVIPHRDSQPIGRDILPRRFNSTTEPRQTPIVRPELNSVSEPKLKPNNGPNK